MLLFFWFSGEVPMTTNTSDPILKDWLKETADMEKMFYADYIALDLLKLLGQCKADGSHVQEVLSLLTFMITSYFTPPGAEVREYCKIIFICNQSIPSQFLHTLHTMLCNPRLL